MSLGHCYPLYLLPLDKVLHPPHLLWVDYFEEVCCGRRSALGDGEKELITGTARAS
jgi:hypothetical protein